VAAGDGSHEACTAIVWGGTLSRESSEVTEAEAVSSAEGPPRQLAISLDRPVLNGMTLTDRNTAIRRLARLLMEAVGADPEEIGDDER
jgi:hypothetical protein